MAFLTRRDRIAMAVIMTLIVAGWGVRYCRDQQEPPPVTVYHDAIPVPDALVSDGADVSALFRPIDINRATRDELMQLPMIGPVKADAIIEYREFQGGFRVIDDLLDVHGIGPATLDRIRDDITIGVTPDYDLPRETLSDSEK